MLETKSACVPGRNLSFHETNKYSFSVNVQEMEHKEKLPHLSVGNQIFQVFLLSDVVLLVSWLRLRLCSLMKVKGWVRTSGRSLLCSHGPAESREVSPTGTASKSLEPSVWNHFKDPQWLKASISKADGQALREDTKLNAFSSCTCLPVHRGKAETLGRKCYKKHCFICSMWLKSASRYHVIKQLLHHHVFLGKTQYTQVGFIRDDLGPHTWPMVKPGSRTYYQWLSDLNMH